MIGKILRIVLISCSISMSVLVIAKGDVKKGEQLSQNCVACHSIDGSSVVNEYPIITGQYNSYIVKQLHEFRSGMRNNAIMSGFATGLSDDDIEDLAAFYSQRPLSQKKSTVTDKQKEIAEQIYYFGKSGDSPVAACSACHGPQGKGIESAKFPIISNQNSEYIKAQLIKFRQVYLNEILDVNEEYRANDPNQMMRQAVKNLTNEEIEALSNYIASLR